MCASQIYKWKALFLAQAARVFESEGEGVSNNGSSWGPPKIFNSDQGAQFTADAFTSVLRARGVRISMDGKGRCLDNVFVERLWRSLKYEHVYLHVYDDLSEARASIGAYFEFYNQQRKHQALGYSTPDELYRVSGQAAYASSPSPCYTGAHVSDSRASHQWTATA